MFISFRKLLSKDEAQRPLIKEIFTDPFIQKVMQSCIRESELKRDTQRKFMPSTVKSGAVPKEESMKASERKMGRSEDFDITVASVEMQSEVMDKRKKTMDSKENKDDLTCESVDINSLTLNTILSFEASRIEDALRLEEEEQKMVEKGRCLSFV